MLRYSTRLYRLTVTLQVLYRRRLIHNVLSVNVLVLMKQIVTLHIH